MKMTLTNDFHNTAAIVRVTPRESTHYGLMADLSRAQTRRAEKKLCGMSDCSCSGALGTRGKQKDLESWEPNQDGSVTIWGIKSQAP